MNRDDVVRMALEAGFAHAPPTFKHWRGTIGDLERFAALVLADRQPAVVSVRLEVKRSLAPAHLWHWAVIFSSGHIYSVSSLSFESAEICMADASCAGLDALHGAEMALRANRHVA